MDRASKSAALKHKRYSLVVLPLLVAGLYGCGGGSGNGGSSGGSSSSSGSSSASVTGFTGGAEFLVNTKVSGSQLAPAATVLRSGNVVVVWTDDDALVNGVAVSNIRAQMLSPAGLKIGSEIVVNSASNTAFYHVEPSISSLDDGGFAVVWRTSVPTDSTRGGISVQRFSADGVRQGSDIMLGSGFNTKPRLQTLKNGNLLIASADRDIASTYKPSVSAMIVSPDGSEIVAPFNLNVSSASLASSVRIAALSSGGFVATWYDVGDVTDTSEAGVKAQIYDAAANPVAPSFLVNTQMTGPQIFPDTTSLPNGGFVIVWEDRAAGGNGDSDIKAQLFTSAGAKDGTEIFVNTNTALRQATPSVVALNDGKFVVSWQDESGTLGDTSGFAVKGQVFNPNGSKMNAEFLVNTNTPDSQGSVVGTSLLNGGFLLTWRDASATLGDSDSNSVKGRVFSPQ